MTLSASFRALRGLALTLALVLGACSTAAPRQDPLPFHVALVPLDVRTAQERPIGTAGAGEAADDALRIELDPAATSEALARVLEQDCFTRVSLMDYPPDEDRAAFLARDPVAQSEHWVRRARELHADLILRGTVDEAPGLETTTNGRVWLNLGILLAGIGPATWAIDDRSYTFDVSLDASLFDVSALASGTVGDLDQSAARILRTRARLEEATLDLLDRASGPGWYVASFLVPAGLLASETDTAAQALQEKIALGLGGELARSFRVRSSEVLGADLLVDFRPSAIEAVRAFDGSVELRGDFRLAVGDSEGLGGLVVRADGVRVREASFGPAEPIASPGGTELSYPLEIRIPPTPDAKELQLEVWDTSRDQNRRTYTVPIREPRRR